ncbi:MAG: hypothetical protein IPP91_17035 [Betaproteobacteria bacterium]|nr:hypothetical protein [Betaproteobacteria bacterium]
MTKYERAIERNLVEIERALFNLAAMKSIERAGKISATEVKVLYWALFNDYIAHCIKVLDRNSKAASFWYVYRTNGGPLASAARKLKVDLELLETLADKLKHVRDLTHFHIDSDAVQDPTAVWRQANIKGSDLAKAVQYVWTLLNAARVLLGKEAMPRPTLDEEAITHVAKVLADQAG